MSDAFSLEDVTPLIEIALMRSGGLIDMDQLVDIDDPVERIIAMAKILMANAQRDPVISKVLHEVGIMGVLREEALRRRQRSMPSEDMQTEES